MADQTFWAQGIAFAGQEDVLFAVRNNAEGVVRIKSIDLLPASSIGLTVLAKTRWIVPITTLSGGIDQIPIKRNLGASDLPSQVKIVRRPDSITLGTGTYRSLLTIPTAITGLGFRGSGFLQGFTGNSAMWKSGYGDSNIEELTIREGEGIAITSPDPQPAYPFTGLFIASLRDEATGRMYDIHTHLTPTDYASASFAIFNGAGSGKTYAITQMLLSDAGDPQQAVATWLGVHAPTFRFLRLWHAEDGKTVDLLPTNPANSVPAGLTVIRNFLSDPACPVYFGGGGYGSKPEEIGFPNTAAAWPLLRKFGTFGHRLSYQAPFAGPGVNTFPPVSFAGIRPNTGFFTKRDKSIVLNPGEVFACIVEGFSCYAEYYFEIELMYSPGVQYPTAAQVQENVVYGSERELVGTLTGGGTGKHRVRSVM